MEKIDKLSIIFEELTNKAIGKFNFQKLLNQITVRAKDFLKCDSCTIWLYVEDKDYLILKGASGRHQIGIDKYYYRKNDGLHWHIFNSGEKYILKKASDAGSIWKGKFVKDFYPDASERQKTGGPFLGVPIIYRDRCMGVLSFAADDINYEFVSKDLDFAEIIAGEIVMAFEYIGSYVENKMFLWHRKTRYTFIAEFAKDLLNCKTLEDIYRLTTQKTMNELNCRTSSIFLFSKDGTLERKYIAGFEDYVPDKEIYQRGQSLTGQTAGFPEEYGRPSICNNFKNESYINSHPNVHRYVENYEKAIKKKFGFDEEVKHVATIPLNGINRTFGVLRIINKIDPKTKRLSSDGFIGIDEDWLILISNIVATAVANVKKRITANLLNKITELLGKKNEDDIYNSISELVTQEETSFSACIIRTFSPQKKSLIVSGSSFVSVDNKKLTMLDFGKPSACKVFCPGKECLIISDINETDDQEHAEWAGKHGLLSMLCLPLKNARNLYLGSISIYAKYKYIFNGDKIEYFTRFAKQLSIVVQVIQEKRELKFLSNLSEEISRKDDIEGVLDYAVCEIPNITGFDDCGIIKRKGDSFAVMASSREEYIDVTIPTSNRVVRKMLVKPEILTYYDINKGNGFSDVRKMIPKIKSLVFIPIVAAKKNLYGTLVLGNRFSKNRTETKNDSENRVYTDVISKLNRDFFIAIANQISTAINKNLLLDKFRTERDRKEVTNEIIRQISSDEDLENNLKTTLSKIAKILKADIGYIALLSKHSNLVEPTCLLGIEESNFPKLEVGGSSIGGWVYENREAYLWPSKEEVDCLYTEFKNLKEEVKTEIIAPLLYRDEVIGLLEVGSYKIKTFEEVDRLYLKTVADQIAVIIQNKKFHIAAEKIPKIKFHGSDVKKNCEILAEKADLVLDQSITCVWLIEEKAGQKYLSMVSSHGVQISDRAEYDMREGEGGISWKTVQSKKEIIITGDLNNSIYKFKHPDFVNENKLEAMISIPLIVVNDVIGVLNSYSRRKYKFLDKEVYLLKNLAEIGAISIENAALTIKMDDIHDRILDSAQLANPGQVAMSFTHDARHTMHNINALISSLIYLLPEKTAKTIKGQDIINSLCADTDYLRKLFDSLVSYASSRKIHYAAVRLKDILDDVLYIYEIRLNRNRVKCEIMYEGDLKDVQLECDKNQMEQVFVNLFNNSIYAIKQKMSKGGLITISVRSLGDDQIEIQFKDNGVGVYGDDLEKVFNPFFTTKGREGSGYGLTICKRIIQDIHHGKIFAQSKNNEYTTFFITLSIINDKTKK